MEAKIAEAELSSELQRVDPDMADLLERQKLYAARTLDLIASESVTLPTAVAAQYLGAGVSDAIAVQVEELGYAH